MNRITLQGFHKGSAVSPIVFSLAYSPCGRQIAAAVSDSTLRVWNTRDATVRKVIRFFNAPVVLAYSPDGNYLVGGTNGNRLELWRARTFVRMTLVGHKKTIQTLAFSADSALLASGSEDTLIIVWNIADGLRWKDLRGHNKRIQSLVFITSALLYSSSTDLTIRMWNLADDSCRVVALQDYHGWMGDAGLTEKLLASATTDNSVRIWNVDTGQCQHVLRHHTELPPVSVTVSTDRRYIVSAGKDQLIFIWDAGSGALLRTICNKADVYSVAIAPSSSSSSPSLACEANGGIQIIQLVPVRWLCAVALALLESTMAPYVLLDVIDFLLAGNPNYGSTSFDTESAFYHHRKISLIERVQKRLNKN
jgi:WD40 repeat protein